MAHSKNPVIFIDIMALIEASFLTKTLNDALARPTLSYPKSTRTGRSIIDDIITMKNNGATIIIFSNCPDTRQANILAKIFGADFQGYIAGKQKIPTPPGIYLQTFTSAHLAEGSNTVDNYDNLFRLELKHRSLRGSDSSYRQILGTELRNQLNKYQHLRRATLGDLNRWVTSILKRQTQETTQAEEASADEPAALDVAVAAAAPRADDTRTTDDTDEFNSDFESPQPPIAPTSERIKIIIHFSAENPQGSGNVFSFTTPRPESIRDLHIAIENAAGLTAGPAQRDYQSNSKIKIDEYTPAANADLNRYNELTLELNNPRLILAMEKAIRSGENNEYAAIAAPEKQFTMNGFRAVTRATTASLTASLDGQATSAAAAAPAQQEMSELEAALARRRSSAAALMQASTAAAASPQRATAPTTPQAPGSPFGVTLRSTRLADATQRPTNQTPPAAPTLTGTAAAFARFGATRNQDRVQPGTPPSAPPGPK